MLGVGIECHRSRYGLVFVGRKWSLVNEMLITSQRWAASVVVPDAQLLAIETTPGAWVTAVTVSLPGAERSTWTFG